MMLPSGVIVQFLISAQGSGRSYLSIPALGVEVVRSSGSVCRVPVLLDREGSY